jgi:hypothetical protein
MERAKKKTQVIKLCHKLIFTKNSKYLKIFYSQSYCGSQQAGAAVR